MEIKRLIINSRTIACLLFRKLSNSTIKTLILGRLPITKHFGNILKPLFSDKSSKKDLILEKKDHIAETFNDFFISVASNLNILRYQGPLNDSDQTEN